MGGVWGRTTEPWQISDLVQVNARFTADNLQNSFQYYKVGNKRSNFTSDRIDNMPIPTANAAVGKTSDWITSSFQTS